MPWSGGGYCVSTLEQASRLECLMSSAPCAQDGSRLLGFHRPTGRAFFAVPSASPDHPYSVDHVQVNSCSTVAQAPLSVNTASGLVNVGSASRWGSDVEMSAYCAVSPESSHVDFSQVGQFFAVGFFVVLALYCSAIGLGAVLRIVRMASKA